MGEMVIEMLFASLRAALCGDTISDEQKANVTDEVTAAVLQMAKRHDMLPPVAAGLQKNGLMTDAAAQPLLFEAVFRYENLQYELDSAVRALEAAAIPFIPLKGSVLRRQYPEPWMRTSCDIDILVHREDLERAVSCLTEKHHYTYQKQGRHDVSLFSKSGVHLELHFDLVEEGRAQDACSVLQRVWDFATPVEGCRYHCEMADEMFYFYHIAHMAKHFENGGCGIRPFADLWILDRMVGADTDKRDALLKEGGLGRFAEVSRRLSKVWLGQAPSDATTARLAEFIITGGVFGNTENHVKVQQVKEGGRIRYFLSKAVLPYENIAYMYPIVKKHRWLTPLMQVRRWIAVLFRGMSPRTKSELQRNGSLSRTQADNTRSFLEDIGL